MEPKTLDLDAVQAFALVAALGSFTRTAEATGNTQSAISLKLKRLETFLGRKLVERTPRSVRLTADGETFLEHAKALLSANERALSMTPRHVVQLRLGISDHAAGPYLPILLSRLRATDPSLVLEVKVGFSGELLEAFGQGRLDGVIVRQERGRRGGETLADDEYAWCAAPSFLWRPDEPLPIASLAPPCGVRAIAVRALDSARLPWREVFVGSGVAGITSAITSGLATAVLARRVMPIGSVDVGAKFGLPRLPRTRVILHARATHPQANLAFRTVSAVFKGMAEPN